ncbi:hypothetical protein LJB99_00325 [Deltaproteobacteria bacterium OttesenSCG-928-K17]|nr:hypothetical protein [Deltaproteobacteria bacterium OttesenSCG-928-K17]
MYKKGRNVRQDTAETLKCFRVAGLYIEGYGRQIVSGLPPDVPVLINEQKLDSKETDLCPGFSVTTYAGSLAAANDLSLHLFHRNIDEMDAFGNADNFVIGRPLEPGSRLESAEEFDPEKLLAAEAPPPEPTKEEAEITPSGQVGLEEALARGAGPADIKEYLAARARAEGLPDRLIANGFSSEGYAIHRNP